MTALFLFSGGFGKPRNVNSAEHTRNREENPGGMPDAKDQTDEQINDGAKYQGGWTYAPCQVPATSWPLVGIPEIVFPIEDAKENEEKGGNRQTTEGAWNNQAIFYRQKFLSQEYPNILTLM